MYAHTLQSQKAVSAYFTSNLILPFGFAQQRINFFYLCIEGTEQLTATWSYALINRNLIRKHQLRSFEHKSLGEQKNTDCIIRYTR